MNLRSYSRDKKSLDKVPITDNSKSNPKTPSNNDNLEVIDVTNKSIIEVSNSDSKKNSPSKPICVSSYDKSSSCKITKSKSKLKTFQNSFV